jgi:SAM-dependent methyltransferase
MAVSSDERDRLLVDVGGGRNPLPGHVNVDPRPDLAEVDYEGTASDLPFEDESVDRIHGNSIVPHIKDLNVAMEEFHRVLKPGGELVLKATHGHSTGIVQDPDHYSWSWTSRTPSWYDEGSEFDYYSEATFELIDVTVEGWCRPTRPWLRPVSYLFGQVIDAVAPDIADELMKLPFAGGRVAATWRKVDN